MVSHCLGKTLSFEQIADRRINDEYEARLLGWLHEHPFISGREFCNAVFEAFALATLLASPDPLGLELVLEYVASHKHNYHLVYFLHHTARDGKVPIECLHVIIGSALEFRSATSFIELHVEVPEVSGQSAGGTSAKIVETEIEVLTGHESDNSRAFRFVSDLGDRPSVLLGNRLSSTYVSLPCQVILSGMQELELTAPVAILADTVSLRAPTLTLKRQPQQSSDEYVLLEARKVNSTLGSISTNGVGLVLAVSDQAGLTYPAVRFAEQRASLPPDPLLKEKYLRLKRILVHFRSHSRGSLAKYRHKIEHDRVLGNEIGRAILQRLLDDGVLTLSGNFYFLQPENVDKHLGVSWADLTKGHSSERLLQYLRSNN